MNECIKQNRVEVANGKKWKVWNDYIKREYPNKRELKHRDEEEGEEKKTHDQIKNQAN